MLSPDLQAAGARHTSAAAPAVITLEWLQEQCDREERVLRLQYEERKLPAEDELAIAQHKGESGTPENTTDALRLWKYLGWCFMRRWDGWQKIPGANSEEAQEAASDLLAATPVRVDLANGRTADVSERSLTCLRKMGGHELRIRYLESAMDDAAALFARVHEQQEKCGVRRRMRLRRRLGRIEELHRSLYAELQAQRRQFYRHGFTPHGGPAEPLENAPPFWRELTAADHGKLIVAWMEAGPLRYARMGKPPESKHKAQEIAEHFGILTVLTSWGIRTKVEPAAMLNRRLGAVLAEIRVSAPPSLEEELEE